jgi:hypothetical protein
MHQRQARWGGKNKERKTTKKKQSFVDGTAKELNVQGLAST